MKAYIYSDIKAYRYVKELSQFYIQSGRSFGGGGERKLCRDWGKEGSGHHAGLVYSKGGEEYEGGGGF
jgi:hypothetical protein